MEHILLSLLVLRGMTIYEIRAYVQQKLSAICSDSLGSIQAGLKKLLEKGYIEAGAYTENNVRKKRYTVTPAGVAFYKEWIGSPINIAKMKSMEEGKFFFL
ncbi:MAG: PadR family transcriptional regulator, partial [Clostridia bacterium]|nr:PadR family transcriptional regulator [Clostridia bacterium]